MDNFSLRSVGHIALRSVPSSGYATPLRGSGSSSVARTIAYNDLNSNSGSVSDPNEALQRRQDRVLKEIEENLLLQQSYPANTSTWVTSRDASIIRPQSSTNERNEEPKTIMRVFADTVAENANAPALWQKPWNMLAAVGPGEQYKVPYIPKSWQEFYTDVRAAARSFISLGLEPHSSVNIMGSNSFEWCIAFLGCIHAGGMAAGIYPQITDPVCHYQAEHSQATVIVVDGAKNLRKYLSLLHNLPRVRAIVQYGKPPTQEDLSGFASVSIVTRNEVDRSKPGFLGVLSWNEFLTLGLSQDLDRTLDSRISSQSPGNCAVLVYTPGTAGNPKAVMLSHDNITWTANAISKHTLDGGKYDLCLNTLPLNFHMAMVMDLFGSLATGMQLYLSPCGLDNVALIVEQLQSVRPTTFITIPYIWDKVADHIRLNFLSQASRVHSWALETGIGVKADAQGNVKLALEDMKYKIGLDRCKFAGSCNAPLSPATLQFFTSVNVTVFECYGLAESTGPQTLNVEHSRSFGTAGRQFRGAEMSLLKQPNQQVGEFLIKGRNVFMGYLQNPVATSETIDDNGYLRTGDYGFVDEKGCITVYGTKVDTVVVSSSTVYSWIMESVCRKCLPMANTVILVGEKQEFLSCFITLKTLPDNVTLAPEVVEYAKCYNVNVATVKDATVSGDFQRILCKGIHQANQLRSNPTFAVKKFAILPSPFTVESGELSPMMKPRKRNITIIYSKVLDMLYKQHVEIRPHFERHPMITLAAQTAIKARMNKQQHEPSSSVVASIPAKEQQPVQQPTPPQQQQQPTQPSPPQVQVPAEDLSELQLAGRDVRIRAAAVEQNLLKHLEIAKHAFVCGENRENLTALITLKTMQDRPDILEHSVVATLAQNNVNVHTVTEAKGSIEVRGFLIKRVAQANSAIGSPILAIRKFIIVPSGFSIATGELLPNGLLNRPAIYSKYESAINKMYVDPEAEKKAKESSSPLLVAPSTQPIINNNNNYQNHVQQQPEEDIAVKLAQQSLDREREELEKLKRIFEEQKAHAEAQVRATTARLQEQEQELRRQQQEFLIKPCGIGIALCKGIDGMKIERLVPGSSAEISGILRVGDTLLSVDGIDVSEASGSTITNLIVGPPGSTVSLIVKRNGELIECFQKRMASGVTTQTCSRRNIESIFSNQKSNSNSPNKSIYATNNNNNNNNFNNHNNNNNNNNNDSFINNNLNSSSSNNNNNMITSSRERVFQAINTTGKTLSCEWIDTGVKVSEFTIGVAEAYPSYSGCIDIPKGSHIALAVEFADNKDSRRLYNMPTFDPRDHRVAITLDEEGAGPHLVPQVRVDGSSLQGNVDDLTLRLNRVIPSHLYGAQSRATSSNLFGDDGFM